MIALEVTSKKREEIIDITEAIHNLIKNQNWQNGALHLFCLHTTCGLTINEGADPAVKKDLMRFFQIIVPSANNWDHSEGNTDAHIRSSLLGVSLLIPLHQGELILGTWQSIYLYEGDGPRKRKIIVQLLKDE